MNLILKSLYLYPGHDLRQKSILVALSKKKVSFDSQYLVTLLVVQGIDSTVLYNCRFHVQYRYSGNVVIFK